MLHASSSNSLLPTNDSDVSGLDFTRKKLNQTYETFRTLCGLLGFSPEVATDVDARLLNLRNDILADLEASLYGIRNTVDIQSNFSVARNNYIQEGIALLEREVAASGKDSHDALELFKQAQGLNRDEDDESDKKPTGRRLRTRSVRIEPFSIMNRYRYRTWNWPRFKYYMNKRLPLIGFIKRYTRYDLFYDFFSAFTVLVTVIPQGIGYALLAGLPPVYGLYAAFTPPMLYTLLGSSKELCVGPVSMISIVLNDAFNDDLAAGSEERVSATLFAGFLAGLFLLAARVLQIGFLIENLLSLPVMSGFTCGAGFLILLSQLKNLFGLPTWDSSATTFIDYVDQLNLHLHEAQLYPSLLGCSTLAIILTMKQLWKIFPASFIMLVVTTAIMYVTEADQKAGIKILKSSGILPSGLPSPVGPWNSLDTSSISTSKFIETSLIIALIGYMESASVAKKFAAKNHYRIHLSQEMLALSFCNIFGSFFAAYPVTGSLSRTALQFQCGSRSPLASFISGVMMGAVLLFATSLFEYIAMTVISAIVISAVCSLIDWEEPYFLWKTNKWELVLYQITLWVVLLLGPEIGVVIAIVLSMFQVLWRAAHPRVVQLGRIVGTHAYRDKDRFPHSQSYPGVLIVRIDARLYFANVKRFREKVERFIRRAEKAPSFLIVDASGINSVDASATAVLKDMAEDMRRKKIQMLLACVKGDVRDFFDEVNLTKSFGSQHFFLTVHDAVNFTLSQSSKADSLKQSSDSGASTGDQGDRAESGANENDDA